ncbi:2-hydroxymuconic semialdehyde dehydrogenase [Thecamonas trahens ATCC 50062]|uniref:2-hydroxymuconic semialdehyde dehydrogenase n=1 Tax=Thecamonas trahens ATCC 50062 TaxID=461836 RepID=A0A0L0D6S6_THETB|nr:2-hydroxymuconic semialdehyde dehydrogenase [Thecamonas trahens ATCC 50062]KNC47796.1 2-hydroxymuconic semialdehyde dehydrogenase [Thecamonas trahens ATCC 50062]|eukprot:XP_013759274.1 2-hydroxymuconic semialdehyde dehydrogenase [Thecamonas trahens ATCC 50062]
MRVQAVRVHFAHRLSPLRHPQRGRHSAGRRQHGLWRRARCRRPLVAHPDVPLVSFTGSTATGERIAKATAPHVKKLSLELGGKNANIVFADADIDAAVAGAVKASFANQGQICLCGSRLFVANSIYDIFMAKFLAAVAALKTGDPADPASNLGALVSAQHKEKVLSYIALAVEEGGSLAAGGPDPPADIPSHLADGYYVSPTVVTGLDMSARCNNEEIFGPVVGVIRFDDSSADAGAAAVIADANAVAYGLSASVWTSDLTRAHTVAQALDVGTVWINCWLVRDLRVPFGGQKHSGVGREGGEYSLEFYTEQKTVCIKL